MAKRKKKIKLPSAEDSFREGWRDVLLGKRIPLSQLWKA